MAATPMADLELLISLAVFVIMVALIVTKILLDRATAAKGSIRIQLSYPATKSGEAIQGDVVLEPLKDIDVESLELTLACYLQVDAGTDDDGSRDYYDKTLFKSKTPIRQRFKLHAGTTQTLPFTVQIPRRNSPNSDHRKLVKYNTLENQRDIRWVLTARLRCGGVDLDDTRLVVVPFIDDTQSRVA